MLDPAVIASLSRAAKEVFGDLPVLAAYAFGSRVSGAPRPDSDLDVGYYLDGCREENRLSIAEEMRLSVRLSQAVGLPVDLRDLAGALLELRGRVLEDGVRIFSGNPAARVALECRVLQRYHDYKEIFQEMHATRLRTIAERGL